MKVILMGYMGCGKSTIGKHLATTLQYEFVDLDSFIQKKEGSTIPEIFNNKGEIYFRKKENLYLKELLNEQKNLVLSLGGGTPCYGENMKAINNAEQALGFYLKASIPILVERLRMEKNERPLIDHLENDDELKEFVGKHLFERSYYYNQAQNTIIIDDKSIEDIVEELVFSLLQ